MPAWFYRAMPAQHDKGWFKYDPLGYYAEPAWHDKIGVALA